MSSFEDDRFLVGSWDPSNSPGILEPPGVLFGKKSVALRLRGKSILKFVEKGSLRDVKSELLKVKQKGGSCPEMGQFLGVYALRLAVVRNHIPILRTLLEAGADPNAKDVGSGWTSLHQALWCGHLAATGVLLEAGASLVVEDFTGLTPVDLISRPLTGSSNKFSLCNASTESYSWGNGANYQLGHATAGVHKAPTRIAALQGSAIASIAAARFHSAALTCQGEVLTWGFGRGGRLGHAEFDIHSGQVAVITPRLVSGLSHRKVKSLAAAKHHTVVSTTNGEVYTWGSNRDGRLGYNSVDTQPTPRRVSTLRSRVACVAASNKHTTAVTTAGEVFTWGCNKRGQLGYGTSNSLSNHVPRVVGYLKDKTLVAVAAAKYHTVVLSDEGEVYTWGYDLVTPRRVTVARDSKKDASVNPNKFQFWSNKLQTAAIAAGFVHSTLVTTEGLVYFWHSGNPSLKAQKVESLSPHKVVAVSSGKFRTAVVTSDGHVYIWDSAKGSNEAGNGDKTRAPPVPQRVSSLSQVSDIAVGENHSIAISKLQFPVFPVLGDLTSGEERIGSPGNGGAEREEREGKREEDEEDEEEDNGEGEGDGEEDEEEEFGDDGVWLDFVGRERKNGKPGKQRNAAFFFSESLRDKCERVLCEGVVDPRNAVQMMDVAEALGANRMKAFCERLVICNLAYILTVTPNQIAQCPPALLAQLEGQYRGARCHLQNVSRDSAFASPPAVLSSDEEAEEEGKEQQAEDDDDVQDRKVPEESLTGSTSLSRKGSSWGIFELDPESVESPEASGSFQGAEEDEDATRASVSRLLRSVRKKLQQIALLEEKRASGAHLDERQTRKLGQRKALEASEKLLEAGRLPPGNLLASTVENEGQRKSAAVSAGKSSLVAPEKKSRKKNGKKGEEKSGKKEEEGDKSEVKGPTLGSEQQNLNFGSVSEVKTGQESQHCDAQIQETAETPPLPVPLASFDSQEPKKGAPKPSSFSKRKGRKGGLSMFLSGALEPQKLNPNPSPSPKSEGTAWGGAVSKMSAVSSKRSLLEIQMEENAKLSGAEKSRDDVGLSSSSSKGRVSGGEGVSVFSTNQGRASSGPLLRDFVRPEHPVSSLLAAVELADASAGPTRSPASWGKSNMEAKDVRSIRDIQNQEQKNAHLRRTKSSSIFGMANQANAASSKDKNLRTSGVHNSSPTDNRWYKPDDFISPSSLLSIQKEEAAMKELRKLYGNVRVVMPSLGKS